MNTSYLGYKMSGNCIKCNVKLNKYNWYKSFQKAFHYVCRKCASNDSLKRTNNFRKNNPELYKLGLKKERLKRVYKLSFEEYEKKYNKQNGVCAICKNIELTPSSQNPNEKRLLSVDHNHKTGKIRGLLCARCNNGLGCFGDNIKLMLIAIDYLGENP